MIEIPESRNLAKQMQILCGKTIESVTVNASPHKFAFFHEDPEKYEERLVGKTIDSVSYSGGYVELYAGEMSLIFSDGPNLRFFEKGAVEPQKHQLLIRFEDGSFFTCSAQMYASMFVFPTGTLDNRYYKAAKEKPSPFDKEFNLKYFLSLFDTVKPTLSTKAFLATEQRIPGLGNGVLQDILLNASIHPKRKLETFKDKEKEDLFYSIKGTLSDMAEQGGRDTEKDFFGKPGGYKTRLSSKAFGKPCPRCGLTIEKETFLGGAIYFCRVCQPMK